jgi:hypothetical protein
MQYQPNYTLTYFPCEILLIRIYFYSFNDEERSFVLLSTVYLASLSSSAHVGKSEKLKRNTIRRYSLRAVADLFCYILIQHARVE